MSLGRDRRRRDVTGDGMKEKAPLKSGSGPSEEESALEQRKKLLGRAKHPQERKGAFGKDKAPSGKSNRPREGGTHGKRKGGKVSSGKGRHPKKIMGSYIIFFFTYCTVRYFSFLSKDNDSEKEKYEVTFKISTF